MLKLFACLDVCQRILRFLHSVLVFGNVLKNNISLSVSAERTIQAKSLAEYALKSVQLPSLTEIQVQGNDQVRFDGIFNIVCPQMEIIANS